MEQQITDGDGIDHQPVGTHDIYLIETEAEDDVDDEIEAEETQRQPKEMAAAALPDATEEEEKDHPFHNIAPRPTVMNDDGPFHEDILQQMILVELYGFTEDILYKTPKSWCGDIRPLFKLSLSHRLSGVGDNSLLAVLDLLRPPLLCQERVYADHNLQRVGMADGTVCGDSEYRGNGGTVNLHRVAHLGEECRTLLHRGFLPVLDAPDLMRLLIIIPFPVGEAPEDSGGEDNGEDKIGGAPEALAVDEEVGQEDLDAVAEADARSDEEEEDGLPFRKRVFRL